MNRFLVVLLAALLGLVLAVSACQKKEEKAPPKVSSEDVKNEAKEAVGAAAEYAKQERDEFVNKAQKDMDAINLKMEELKKKAQDATGEAKAKIEQQIERLEPERQVAEEKLAALKSATGEAWKDLKADVEAAIDRLKQSF